MTKVFLAMSLKVAGLGAVAAASTFSMTALAATPAHSLSLSGTFNFGGSVDISGTPNNYNFDFLSDGASSDPGTAGDISIGSGEGSFQGVTEDGAAKIKDLSTGAAAPGFSTTPVLDFITGIKLSTNEIVSFYLTNFQGFTNSVAAPPIGTFGFNGGIVEGVFRDTSGTVLSRGSLNAQFTTDTFTGLTQYSASLDVVPSPALLPGLIGMGVAALRRRKSSDVEDIAESEA